MKSRIWHRYAVCFVTIAVVIELLINLAGYQWSKSFVTADHGDRLYRAGTSISNGYADELREGGLTLSVFMAQMRAVKNMIAADVWLVDADGTLLTTTGTNTSHIGINLKRIEPDLLHQTWVPELTIEEFEMESSLFAVSPVLSGVQIRGYVVLHEPMSQVMADVKDVMRQANVIAVAFLLTMLAAFIGFAVHHTRMVRRLGKAAAAYADGDFSQEPSKGVVDEYLDLGNSLHLLGEQHANLVDYQKTFIANISHDFRSPLTSIKGYAEAMKDGTIPYEIQGKYLNIILFETDRLSNLTNDLLDLSNFENKGVTLMYSDFDIAKLLRQAAMTFEGKCSQKNLKIRLVFPENEIMVRADKGKIQQVVHNLVDNAIKFSNTDGVIVISVVERKEKVLVSVKDSGIGIPKESISKVWERFYKTDLSRGKDKRGTGLGLSITKQIIAAHNENIKVTSTEGVGTEFVFSLSRSQG